MTRNELLKELGINLLFICIIYFFYRSWWAFILLPPASVIYHLYNKKKLLQKSREMLACQFKDALISITAALRAGYSFENALNEGLHEMSLLYGSESVIYLELSKVVNEIHLGVNAETALSNMAARSKVEDIEIFASVFRIAKNSGGDLVEILKKTSDDIASKIDTRNEISVLISSKRMEQNIMSFMPLAILVYIGLTSPSMLAPLYGNALGVVIMTLCLGLYAFAYYLSLRIMNIEV